MITSFGLVLFQQGIGVPLGFTVIISMPFLDFLPFYTCYPSSSTFGGAGRELDVSRRFFFTSLQHILIRKTV